MGWVGGGRGACAYAYPNVSRTGRYWKGRLKERDEQAAVRAPLLHLLLLLLLLRIG